MRTVQLDYIIITTVTHLPDAFAGLITRMETIKYVLLRVSRQRNTHFWRSTEAVPDLDQKHDSCTPPHLFGSGRYMRVTEHNIEQSLGKRGW